LLFGDGIYFARRLATSNTVGKPAPGTRLKNPLRKMLLRTLLVVLAMVPVFALPYPFELDLFIPLLMLLFALATV